MRRTLPTLAAAIALAGCGPIHPRWKNDTDQSIVVTYVHGKNAFHATIRPGQAEKPLSMIDFAEIETIFVDEQGKRTGFSKQEIATMHERCGHGYSCTISYQGEGKTMIDTI